MKIITYIFIAVLSLCAVSCNKWLDVKPSNQIEAEKNFKTEKGYRNALIGCYIALNSADLYGGRLIASNIESLAQHWIITQTAQPADYYLSQFDYANDYAKSAIRAIYAALYNVITQTNVILNYLPETGDVINDQITRGLIEGEALAIRAFCHFDLLRLFGECPTGSTIKVSLPYSETASVEIMPPYYDYNTFIAKIENDLVQAANLLKDTDPAMDYTLDDLNWINMPSAANNRVDLESDFFGYRQFRFNYWAVKALLARFYLYTGQTAKAYTAATEMINAQTSSGETVVALSGRSDIATGYCNLPSECIIGLSNFRINTLFARTVGYLTSVTSSDYSVNLQMLADIFAGENLASNNRYLQIWNRQVVFGTELRAVIKKYNTSANRIVYDMMTKVQVVPLIRMSEMYLIAMETTSNLSEANSLYKEYMEEHDVLVVSDLASLDDVRTMVFNEYRRELYGEGQMFYTYKRHKSPNMLWRYSEVSESNYIIPLPDTEYNPNL